MPRQRTSNDPKEVLSGREEALRRIEKCKKTGSGELDLSGLKLKEVPSEVAELSGLETLRLNNNQITAIPEVLGRLTNLQWLDLDNNQIAAIPEVLGRLTNLQRLYLHNNQITAIPEVLGRLTNLQRLYLHNNQITAIPEALGRLTNLQRLDLDNNQITTIPEVLGRLTNLQTLYLADNQITAIPEVLGQLTNLHTLSLAHNQITVIPEVLGRLTNLQMLHLAENQITAIPEVLGRLDKLTRLFLHGNPGLGLPAEILGPTWRETVVGRAEPRLPREILAYYFANRAASRPLNEAKLILVGHGGVGKTSLVKKWTTGKFKKSEPPTPGIKITDWKCNLSGGRDAGVHIWDFGGQEMMHATHRFFLTERSLYLLVLDRRLGQHDVQADYWFRMIRAYGGPQAPVIVILNKQVEEPFDVNQGRWQEIYGDHIRGFVKTDCTNNVSMARLKESIQQELDAMKSVHEGFPARWFEIKNHLTGMQQEFITFHDYKQLCQQHGETDPDSQNLLAGFLRDLGIALNYRDDPRLRFAYVLKPEWVTEGIYALLHAPAASAGVLEPRQARAALDEKRYGEDAVDFLLGLMEQFELSFPLNDSGKRLLIPQLLPDQQPTAAGSFQPANCLNFGYRYSIVPEGLLPRFIVRTHHLSAPENRWKSGVILKHRSGCRALVRGEPTANQVRIYVEGPVDARRDLLAIVRHNFDTIHTDFKLDPNPEELIYAEGIPEEPQSKSKLETLRKSGERTIAIVTDGNVVRPEIDDMMKSVEPLGTPLRLFLSYAHKDEKHVGELRKSLTVMARNGLIRPWYDREIVPGHQWEQAILKELEESDAIICQLSRDFLGSEFCMSTELATAIERQAKGEAALIAYVLRKCGWKRVPELKQFQLLPKDAKPLREWKDPDGFWEAVTDGIEKALETLQNDPRFCAKLEREDRYGFRSRA